MKHTPVAHAPLRALSRTGRSGFTIAEAVVAVAISAMCLGGVMLLNAHQLKLVKSTRQSNSATYALLDRIEQLRLSAWKNITDTDWLKTQVENSRPASLAFLANCQETFRLSAWPTNASVQPLEVSYSAKDGYKIVSDSTGMKDQNQGRVDWIVKWTGTDGRIRERSYATIISNGGISRVGLTGWGGFANIVVPDTSGGTNFDNGGTSGSGSTDSGGSTSGDSGSGSNGNGNGNGKGQGNTGGKGGKG